MNAKNLVTSLLIVMLFCSFLVKAQDFIFVTEDLPPLQIENKNTKASGAMVELIELIIKEANINARIEFYPWARSYDLALTRPNTFIFSMLRSIEREDKFIWIDKLFTLRSYLAALKSRTDIKINDISDAKKYTVSSIRQDLAEDYLLANGFTHKKNLYVTKKYNVLWQALYSGRTDLAFTNSMIWQHEITSSGLDASKLNLVYEIPNFASELYLAANSATESDVINRVKTSLASIKADGRYDKLLAKWHIH